MRHKFAAALTFVLLLAGQQGVSAQVAADPEVIRSENRWNEAYKARDQAALKSILADDFLITEEDGKTYDNKAYLDLLDLPNLRVDISEFSDLKARRFGKTAVVTGGYHVRGTSKGVVFEYHDRFTDVWMHIGKRWLLVASHYSPIS